MTDPTDAPPPPGTTSPLAIVSMITGGLGLLFMFVGCCMGGPALQCPASLLCIAGIATGYMELQNVNSGASPESTRGLAMAGLGTGGAGCGIGALVAFLLAVFMVLYFVFVVFLAIAGNM